MIDTRDRFDDISVSGESRLFRLIRDMQASRSRFRLFGPLWDTSSVSRRKAEQGSSGTISGVKASKAVGAGSRADRSRTATAAEPSA